MKVLIVCLALCAVVMAERCQQTSDCKLTLCSTGASITCIRGECTCTTSSGSTCTTAQDCHVECHDRDSHCVDGRCHCRHGGNQNFGR
ncbi:serine protease inhibitor Cvsi-2-like [Mytilus trossulus]|uniref:serine protease inhibitor Cvsi-2-like n=1 Tax=Mytilus trossulus TaxID=6551 RepID=UPI003005CBFA